MEFVEIIEQETGIQANKNFLKLHSSDVEPQLQIQVVYLLS